MKNVTVDLVSDLCWEEKQANASLVCRRQRSLDPGNCAATGGFRKNIMVDLISKLHRQNRWADVC